MMKRCYYISNSYDGAYFVLTDNIESYIQKMASYVINLEGSQKANHYSFGSVEMTAIEYDRHSTEASRLESSLINQKNEEKSLAASEVPTQDKSDKSDKKPSHLRLV